MLRIVDIADGKRQNIFSIFRDFVLLSEPRGPDLEPGVEHFFNFWRICSTFGAARGTFEVDGRQNTVVLFRFCLLLGPRALDLGAGVDKKRSFCFVFVYFEVRAAFLGSVVDKKRSFCFVFVYFEDRAGSFWSRR